MPAAIRLSAHDLNDGEQLKAERLRSLIATRHVGTSECETLPG